MTAWLTRLDRTLGAGDPAVLVSVVAAEGSTPREPGAHMVVTAADSAGTIGGGHLEYRAVQMARDALAGRAAPVVLERFVLGPSLGQCCGGRASVLLELIGTGGATPPWLRTLLDRRAKGRPVVLATVIDSEEGQAGPAIGRRLVLTGDAAVDPPDLSVPAQGMARLASPAVAFRTDGGVTYLLEAVGDSGFPVVLFGAGHVGRAVVRVLSTVPCDVTWIDGREDAFPADLPDNVRAEVSQAPVHDVAAAAPGGYYLVMTHSHALDQRICEAVLKRGDFAYLGLIGSETKRRKFESRLRARGVSEGRLRRMVCPIGIAGITGKDPGAVAVAVAAELLLWRDSGAARASPLRDAAAVANDRAGTG